MYESAGREVPAVSVPFGTVPEPPERETGRVRLVEGESNQFTHVVTILSSLGKALPGGHIVVTGQFFNICSPWPAICWMMRIVSSGPIIGGSARAVHA